MKNSLSDNCSISKERKIKKVVVLIAFKFNMNLVRLRTSLSNHLINKVKDCVFEPTMLNHKQLSLLQKVNL